MITWLSTKSPVKMLDPPINDKLAEFLRENRDVDVAILAVDLGMPSHHLKAQQRRLGLRKFSKRQ
jgi:hypothetical protein